MTWQEKMSVVIGEVLGEGYSIKVIDDATFEVYFVDSFVSRTQTLDTNKLLPSHWREYVKSAIMIIISQNIRTALEKV